MVSLGLGVVLASVLAAGEPVPLEALTATSGEHPERVLDGKPQTGWSPTGDPDDEGILFRFESLTPIDQIDVQACPGSDAFGVSDAINGTEHDHRRLDPKTPVHFKLWAGTSVRSVFLRLEAATGKACIGEVSFLRGGATLAVRPPRSFPGRVTASSTLKPIDAYLPAYLFDGRIDFGWVEGVDGPGIGESVTATFDQPVTISAIEIWNGYQRSEDHFHKNARAKRISFGTPEKTTELALTDTMGAQKLALPAPLSGTTFTLKVLDAVRGKKYQDLVISELRFWDAQGPFTLASGDLAERQAVLRKDIAGKPLEQVVDKHQSAVCLGDYTRRDLKLRTNHTLVWYEDQTSPPADVAHTEVVEGVWIINKQGSPWSEAELYARRHRTVTTEWDPYSAAETKESDKIAGGTIQVARVADLGPKAFWDLMKTWKDKGAEDQVGCLFEGDPAKKLQELVAADAIVVQGQAITDVLEP